MMEKAALFIDYENVFYYLKNTFKDPPDLGNHTAAIIRALKKHLEEVVAIQPIITNAYADFERLGTGSLSTLYLMGIQAQNVLGTGHKNAADMQMCIDLMQIHYTRNDIQNFVILAGDRDYIPVVQHLKRQGRRILVSAFRDTLSGDLLEIIGERDFLDISPFLSSEARAKLERHRAASAQKSSEGQADKPAKAAPPVPGKIALNKEAATVDHGNKKMATEKQKPAASSPNASDVNAEKCLQHILNYIEETGYKEPGLTPLLRYLTDEMPLLANWERKELISKLERMGAISIATRSGYDYPYSVIQVNHSHALVRES